MSELPWAKKSLGQHWLEDTATLVAMCEAAELGPKDTVLEIGPGIGTLTRELVQRADRVIAVEFDESLAKTLPLTVQATNLQVVHADILSFDLSKLPPGYKVAANIPYYLTSKLLRRLSEAANPPEVMALLVQKEVAERIAALPGDLSLLGVSVQYFYEAVLGPVVPAMLFTPPPKVDSQIVKLIRHQKPLFADVNEQLFFRLVKAGFSARRKKLRSSLSGGLGISKKEAVGLLEKAYIDPDLRAQALSLEQWYMLYQQARLLGIFDPPTALPSIDKT